MTAQVPAKPVSAMTDAELRDLREELRAAEQRMTGARAQLYHALIDLVDAELRGRARVRGLR